MSSIVPSYRLLSWGPTPQTPRGSLRSGLQKNLPVAKANEETNHILYKQLASERNSVVSADKTIGWQLTSTVIANGISRLGAVLGLNVSSSRATRALKAGVVDP